MSDAARAVYMIKRKPNRLLQFLIFISVGIHLVIFLHVSGLYRSSALDYMELSMQDISKPLLRTIPRPIHRVKPQDQPRDFKKIRVNRSPIPRINPTKVEPTDSRASETLMARISVPELPSDMGAADNTYSIGEILSTEAEFTTARDYYEMVMLKIEASKKYPESAKSMEKEGRVTLGFVLTPQGIVKNIRIIKSCRHEILDQAAIQAVKDAVPFPRPPFRLFKTEIPMELNIVFEIT